MTRFLLLSFTLCCFIFLSACKKKKQEAPAEPTIEPVPAPVYPDYSQLKTGNYWIYGRYQVETDDTETYMDQTDSCYVEKDTTIRNQRYYVMHSYDFLFQKTIRTFLRDSLHYIVSSDGSIFFSSENFTTVFLQGASVVQPGGDTLYTIMTKMEDKDVSVTTPAGTFITSNMKTQIIAYPSVSPNQPYEKKYMDRRYARNVGVILETEPLFFSAPFKKRERKLLRYRVN